MKATIVLAAALLLLTGCSSFKLGSMHYCAAGSACETKVSPFRPGEPVPAGAAGQEARAAVPVVSQASAPR